MDELTKEEKAELEIKKQKWLKTVKERVITKGLDRLIHPGSVEQFFHLGLAPAQTVNQIKICLLDDERVTAIYPVSQMKKFSELTRFAGYSERLATEEDIEENPHKVWKKKKRATNADDKRGYTVWDKLKR